MNARLSIIFLLLIYMNIGFTQVPKTLSYQGHLARSKGEPVEDGLYKMRFELHTTQNNAIIAWQETQDTVRVTGGIFSVVLGSVNPLDIRSSITVS